jgi:hypothetical protein
VWGTCFTNNQKFVLANHAAASIILFLESQTAVQLQLGSGITSSCFLFYSLLFLYNWSNYIGQFVIFLPSENYIFPSSWSCQGISTPQVPVFAWIFPHKKISSIFLIISHFPFSARFRISLEIASAYIGSRGGFLSFIVKILVHLNQQMCRIFVTITMSVFQICCWTSRNPDSPYFVLDPPPFQHYCAIKFEVFFLVAKPYHS